MPGSRVVVTGASGFVGSHLVRRLAGEGMQVGVLIRSNRNVQRIKDVLPRLQVFHADLRDHSSVADALTRFQPECLVHLAWQGVGNRERNDLQQLENLSLALNLLRAARAAGCQTYVGVGSQAEYGACRDVISEDTPNNPTTIYGLTKLCHCLQAREFCASAGMRFVWLRLFSSYGPDDDPSWMIPYLVQTLLRGETPSLTLGEQKWDYIHVRDVAGAILAVVQNAKASGIYNLGSGDAATLRSTIEYIRDLIDPSLSLGFGQIPYRPDQVMFLQADISRLAADTGWRPGIRIQEGLREVVNVYKAALSLPPA